MAGEWVNEIYKLQIRVSFSRHHFTYARQLQYYSPARIESEKNCSCEGLVSLNLILSQTLFISIPKSWRTRDFIVVQKARVTSIGQKCCCDTFTTIRLIHPINFNYRNIPFEMWWPINPESHQLTNNVQYGRPTFPRTESQPTTL